MQPFLAVVQLLATLGALGAALASLLTVKALVRQTQAQVVLGCLQTYLGVRRERSRALRECDKDAGQEYYRELFDLHWTEFNLHRRSLVPADMTRAWLDARHRNFRSDALEFRDRDGQSIRIGYAEAWERLVERGYWAPDDPFVAFMKLVHEGRVDQALESVG